MQKRRTSVERMSKEEKGRKKKSSAGGGTIEVQPKKEPACSIRRNMQENEMRYLECEGMGH